MVRNRIVLDKLNDSKHNKTTFNPHKASHNMKLENLDDNSNETTTPECPISIIPAKPVNPSPASKVETLNNLKPQTKPPDRSNSTQSEESLVNFPIYAIVDSSD